MPLFGSDRDVSLFRKMNRELLGNIINQQCSFFKFRIDKTNINIYGEASEEKYYMGPTILNCLLSREDQKFANSDMVVDFNHQVNFKFLRDDLVEADLKPEVGDIIFYEKNYFEIDNVVTNQYFSGKNPDYPNKPNNPYTDNLDKFGYNVSILCQTHYVPGDKTGISKERLI